MAAAAAAAAAAASAGVTLAPGGLPITPAAAAAALAPSAANKRAREIYIGNLPQGIIGSTEIRELFNLALANFVPDPVTNPPVVEVKMDPTGRYAFVELRTFDLTHHILQLDKVEVAGKPLKIGRPKGYEEEVVKMEQMQKLAQAQSFAAQLSGGPTNVILMVNLMPARAMLNPQDRRELFDDVFAEAVKIGPVAGVAVPVPASEEDVDEDEPCRVYIKYHTISDAKKCKEAMDGRLFDERTVNASFSNEIDYNRAHLGEWIMEVPSIQFVERLPGPPMM
jgi:splicing factor U2AF subunit